LAAILVADVVGYSRITEKDEAATFERRLSAPQELFKPKIAKHDGRIGREAVVRKRSGRADRALPFDMQQQFRSLTGKGSSS
jgi:class 3 adenylate cyclase